MTSTHAEPLIPAILEPERLRQRLQNRSCRVATSILIDQPMAEEKTLMDFLRPNIDNFRATISPPGVDLSNFELRPPLIRMLQNSATFHALSDEDPHLHISNFVEICKTFKINGASDDAIRLRMFPFSLKDKAKSWLNTLPPGSITTWDDLVQKFLYKYFPPIKTANLCRKSTLSPKKT
jgi:hypothetical protein